VKINSAERCKVDPYDLATQLVLQLFTSFRRYVLLVADAPVDVLGSSIAGRLLFALVPDC